MNTFAEIEAAAASLPRRELRKLHSRLGRKLKLATAKKAPRASLHDLMKDLCGSVHSGVGDLSDKKKHLRLSKYGKA